MQSFQGVISGNNILRNGLYNLGIDGASDVPGTDELVGDRGRQEDHLR